MRRTAEIKIKEIESHDQIKKTSFNDSISMIVSKSTLLNLKSEWNVKSKAEKSTFNIL